MSIESVPPPFDKCRFEVAFSFAGPHREKAGEIAKLVAQQLGKDRVFFDEWYEAEILGDDMDVLLQRFYHEQSLLVIADLSEAYAGRPWCQAEARAIRALRFDIDPARDETQRLRLLNVRFAGGAVPGIQRTTGVLDGENNTAKYCADLILERLELLRQRLGRAVRPGGAAGFDDVASHQLPVEQRYALIIGIGNYGRSQRDGAELPPDEFSNLRFSVDDAVEFDRCLAEARGHHYKRILLRDEEASLRGIKQAFDRLRQTCREDANPNAVVIIYFSGHGAADGEGRHYLVPHDGKRNDLFATALRTQDFELLLSELNTNRLIVVLDACHGGAFAAPGAKDSAVLEFDPRKLSAAPSGSVVIASCLAAQQSRELEGHGVFTSQFLKVLKGDVFDFPTKPVDLRNLEQIDLWDAFRAVKEIVEQTAREQCGGAVANAL